MPASAAISSTVASRKPLVANTLRAAARISAQRNSETISCLLLPARAILTTQSFDCTIWPVDSRKLVSRLQLREREKRMRVLANFGFLVLFFFLLAAWAVSWLAFHVASAGIHVLLGLAVVFLVIHLMRDAAA